jgi:hypothetical protein
MAKSETLSETRQKLTWDKVYEAGRLQGLEEARELIEISRAIVCKVRLSVGDELRVKLLEKMDFWLMEHDEAIREKADG